MGLSSRKQVDHKRTFYLLEQLILKHRAHLQTTSVKEVRTQLLFAGGSAGCIFAGQRTALFARPARCIYAPRRSAPAPP